MRRTLSVGAAMLAAGLVAVAPAGAQGRQDGRVQGRGHAKVPPGQRPPAGLCRVWIDGVPPGHQPGVTDCAYAYSHVPANGRVIYGGRATRRSDVVSRQYEPYYYGAPSPGGSNRNYIQRTRDRLKATRAEQLNRDGDDDRSDREWKHEKEHDRGEGHGNGHGNGHGRHDD